MQFPLCLESSWGSDFQALEPAHVAANFSSRDGQDFDSHFQYA
ncbi:unnamed protein product, partial [Brassica rapa subsp. trilocularis]